MSADKRFHVETTADAVLVEALTLDAVALSPEEATRLAARLYAAAHEVKAKLPEPPTVRYKLRGSAAQSERVAVADWIRGNATAVYERWREEGCPGTWADFLAEALLKED